jgi:hypothetical protein
MAKKAKTKTAPRSKARGKPARPSWEGRKVKDLSESEKYARRLALNKAKGLSRQQARGHKEKAEHKTREKRERLKYFGLTIRERNAVYDFGIKQAHRDPNNDDPDAFAQALVEWAGINGYDRFKEVVKEQQRLAKIKRVRPRGRAKAGKRVEMPEGRIASKRSQMEDFAERLGLPDWRVLFYH